LLAGRNVLLTAPPLNLDEIEFLPSLVNARKIICIGLNYLDHSAESGFKPPEYPGSREATKILSFRTHR